MLKWDDISNGWAEFRTEAQQRWQRLTERDLDAVAGKYEQLSVAIQKRYGVAREDAEQAIHDWLAGEHSSRSPRQHE